MKFKSRIKDIKAASASVSVNIYDYNARVTPVTSYQAQLLQFSNAYYITERAAFHALFRAPFNTFRHGDFFHLSKLGCPKIRSFNITCAAALYRTAARTTTTWPEWIRQLQASAYEHLLAQAVAAGKLCPDFWDSPPIALNLKIAFEGFPRDPKLSEPGKEIIRYFMDKNRGRPPAPGSEVFMKEKSLQKYVHGILMNHIFPYDETTSIEGLIESRLTKMFHPYDLDFEQVLDIGASLRDLKKLGTKGVSKVYKNWLNGWTTSYRMHEGILMNCLLGCRGEPDSPQHYIQCPHMYAFSKYFLQTCSSDPLVRIGLINYSHFGDRGSRKLFLTK